MAQLRSRTAKAVTKVPDNTAKKPNPRVVKRILQTAIAKDDDIETVIQYPMAPEERAKFINHKTNKTITPFQYRVYDLCAQIPRGHFSTYKAMSDALRSSPRAVGQALKLNPFAPLPVPCHRVIATNLSIGGFAGGSGDCANVADKKAKLTKEGCTFNEYYELEANADGTKTIFTDFKL